MESYISAKNQHPAWILLASHYAPSVLSCLKTLFEKAHDGIPPEDAVQSLSSILTEHVNQEQCDTNQGNLSLQVSRKLREQIKRRLVVERDGCIFTTDALEVAAMFVESPDNRLIISMASCLPTIQQEVENSETGLNFNSANRVATLCRRIAELERELQEAEVGHIEALETYQVVEHIREILSLASSLRTDLRRVEDSWRKVDRALRQPTTGEQYHRDDIIECLFSDQDALLNTPERRIFNNFRQQLCQSVELMTMSERLCIILSHPSVSNAFNRLQCHDLRWLVKRPVDELQTVLQARARSE